MLQGKSAVCESVCIETVFDKEIITLFKPPGAVAHIVGEERVVVILCAVTSQGAAEVTGNTEFDLVSGGLEAVPHSSLRVFLLKNARSERY